MLKQNLMYIIIKAMLDTSQTLWQWITRNACLDMFQVACRSTYFRSDVNVNNYASSDSEYKDESLSSEQLKISPELDLSDCLSILTAKLNSNSS